MPVHEPVFVCGHVHLRWIAVFPFFSPLSLALTPLPSPLPSLSLSLWFLTFLLALA